VGPRSAAVLVAALLVLACTPELDWRELSSSEGRFTALMPSKPREDVRRIAATPPAVMHLWSTQAATSLFGIGYVDYVVLDRRVLETTRDALIRNLHGHLIREGPVTQSGLAGRTFVAQSDNTVLHARLLVSGRRVYQIAVLGPKDSVAEADVELFLSSFKPLGPAGAP
jgi:hypothetical protein